MTPKEQAEYTIRELENRKQRKLEGIKQADSYMLSSMQKSADSRRTRKYGRTR